MRTPEISAVLKRIKYTPEKNGGYLLAGICPFCHKSFKRYIDKTQFAMRYAYICCDREHNYCNFDECNGACPCDDCDDVPWFKVIISSPIEKLAKRFQ